MADPSPGRPSNVMAGACTIALIVHGVGDHTQTDILGNLEWGLRQSFPPDSFEYEKQRLTDFLLPSGARGDADVARLRMAGADHFLIPVVWSREHLRIRPEVPAVQIGGSVQFANLVMMKVLRPVSRYCMNLFRCVPKASGMFWKLTLLAAALVASALAIIAVFALPYCFVFARYVLTARPKGFNTWPYLLAALLLSLIAIPVLRRISVLFDMVGDVASHVGSEKDRRAVEKRMLEIVEWTQEQAPAANIIVVGHSLGSVLVTHSLLEASPNRSSRLLLMTLGSPLPMMSRIFPRYIAAPRQLLERLTSSGIVSFWLHLWRDSDWIGRSLGLENTEAFAEASVGDGLHPNYWADLRIWKKLFDLMKALDAATVPEFLNGLNSELSQQELVEAFQIDHGFRAMPWMALVCGAALWWVGRDVFGSALAAKVGRRSLWALRTLYLANCALLLPIGLANFVTSRLGTPREILGHLRLTSSWFSLCMKLWLSAAVAFLTLRWLAPLF